MKKRGQERSGGQKCRSVNGKDHKGQRETKRKSTGKRIRENEREGTGIRRRSISNWWTKRA